MNILFIADVSFRKPASGSEQVLYHQVRGLAEAGHDIAVINRINGDGAIDFRRGQRLCEGTYYANPGRVLRFGSAVYRFPAGIYRKLASTRRFDIAICHQPFTLFGLLARRVMKNHPIVYVYHSPSHEEFALARTNNPGMHFRLQVFLRKMIERICVKRANQVVVLSCYMKRRVARIHGLQSRKISVNPGGVDLNRFKPDKHRAELKNTLNLPDGKIHLLTIRNLDPRMGLDNLLRAVSLLKAGRNDIHLTIGGEGPERERLLSMVRTLGLDREVDMLGFIPADVLAQYYAGADFFILPTRDLEGFGLVTPESLACGTPVLGTPIGGTKEILTAFDSELLFNGKSPEAIAAGIQSALENIYSRKDLYRGLRLKCRAFAEDHYSWDRHIEGLLQTCQTFSRTP